MLNASAASSSYLIYLAPVLLTSSQTDTPIATRLLARVIGVGTETADLLVQEALSRNMRDRRALARYAGLTGSPDESGRKCREKGFGYSIGALFVACAQFGPTAHNNGHKSAATCRVALVGTRWPSVDHDRQAGGEFSAWP